MTGQLLTIGSRLDRAVLAAAEAWDRYASTVHTGGTPEQRQWAFGRAVQAEMRAAKAEDASKAASAKQNAKAA